MALKNEATIHRLFDERGFSESFGFIGKVENGKRDADFSFRCKRCGAVSTRMASYYLYRYPRLICGNCGASSDGNDVWARSKECDAAMEFYQQGHSVSETAERFGVTKAQINNAVKARGVTNGKDWKEAGTESNDARHEQAMKAFDEYIKSGGRDYLHIWDTHKRRAVKFGCKYDKTVTLSKLIKKNGVRCAICGRVCDRNDREWGSYGPSYPTIDHIVPMSKGGGHTWDNVQVACARCNILKSDKEVSDGKENI